MTPSNPHMDTPSDSPDRQRRNVRLGLVLAVFILVVFGITMWKFRPL